MDVFYTSRYLTDENVPLIIIVLPNSCQNQRTNLIPLIVQTCISPQTSDPDELLLWIGNKAPSTKSPV